MTSQSPFDPRYREYFELLNRGKYFEAHEVLELLWRETRNESRDFYQGMIQLAAVLVHLQKNNFAGAEIMFRKAGTYLIKYPQRYLGINIAAVLKKVEQCLKHPEILSQFSVTLDGDEVQNRF